MFLQRANLIMMNRFIILLTTDVKMIFRDKTLAFMFFVPLIFIFILRMGAPVLIRYFPVTENYVIYGVAFFSSLTSIFPAFIISFIMLDEKDEGLFPVFRILPVEPVVFIIYRTAFIFLAGTIGSVLIMNFSGIQIDVYTQLFASVSFGLSAPIVTLVVVAFAENKIEGLTMMKILNSFLALAMVSLFVPAPWKYLLGVLPLYWPFQLFLPGEFGMGEFFTGVIGVVYSFLFLTVTIAFFRKRIYGV